ncbi:MAG: single-stranded DNA-binding protein [Christensenellaceae bacterium]|nr:single-stranded DNA-binding protein [Christensenellaceae bacterium]
MQNNKVEISGCVTQQPMASHYIYGEMFYTFPVEVTRLSGNIDSLPVLVPGRLLEHRPVAAGQGVWIMGQLRSYNRIVEGASRLELKVFARQLRPFEGGECVNRICLCGYLCKPPVYRKTPFGREIADLLVAVNRAYDRSDYIPAIAWGQNARRSAGRGVGSKLSLEGRIQSRDYEKHLPDGKGEVRRTYEVSIFDMQFEEE